MKYPTAELCGDSLRRIVVNVVEKGIDLWDARLRWADVWEEFSRDEETINSFKSSLPKLSEIDSAAKVISEHAQTMGDFIKQAGECLDGYAIYAYHWCPLRCQANLKPVASWLGLPYAELGIIFEYRTRRWAIEAMVDKALNKEKPHMMEFKRAVALDDVFLW